ncbi:MAG: pilus assembly protein TadG-related protein [Terracidiphilus sp.]
MKNINLSFIRCAVKDESGQILLPWVAIVTLSFLGITGLVTDVGRAYLAKGQLQNYANAAALAAAGNVYNTGSTDDAYAYATKYSGTSGDNNASGLGTVTTTVYEGCVNTLLPSGQTCSSSTTKNAVQVTESTTVRNYIMPIFWGSKTMTVSATATASMQGVSQPWNVAIIIDSTGSMATTDTNCNSLTEFQCALTGTQALLQAVNPCPVGLSSCSGSTANFRVSLFTFPNVLTSENGVATNSISDELNCSGTPATWTDYSAQPIAAPFTLPVPGAALSGAPNTTYMTYKQTSNSKLWEATYQITPFLSDYYSPSSTGGLNSSSNLVKAVGYGSTSGCLTYTFGIWGTGSGSGFGNTYFASAIYEAQSALNAAQTAYGGNNAIIFLSDGQANASYYSDNSSAYGTANSTNQYADAYEFPSGPAGSEVGPTSTSPSDPVPAYYTPATSSSSTLGYSALEGNGKGVYPSWWDQCQQGIVAGQYAANQGTRVYSVAYGSEDSGCASGWNIGETDTTLVATGKNQSFTLSTLNPCMTMENIASSLSYFYSDYNQSGSGSTCQDSSHTVSSLNDIFTAIAATFTTPRMLPNSLFLYGVHQTS